MPRFVLVAHEVPTVPEFSLDDLPGAGRVDLLARCLTSAFLLSHDIREDVRAWVVVRDELTIRFDGTELRGLNPDERSTAALVRRALERQSEAVGHQPVEVTPGLSVYRVGLERTLGMAATGGPIVHLHEAGTPVVALDPSVDPTFVLSDHLPLTEPEAECIADVRDARIRLGPQSLHADQAISVAHNYLDTDGFRQY